MKEQTPFKKIVQFPGVFLAVCLLFLSDILYPVSIRLSDECNFMSTRIYQKTKGMKNK